MLHELAAAAGEWLSDAPQLRSPTPPHKPAAAVQNGGDSQALQHIAEVRRFDCMFPALHRIHIASE